MRAGGRWAYIHYGSNSVSKIGRFQSIAVVALGFSTSITSITGVKHGTWQKKNALTHQKRNKLCGKNRINASLGDGRGFHTPSDVRAGPSVACSPAPPSAPSLAPRPPSPWVAPPAP